MAVYQITLIIASVWSGMKMNSIGRRKTVVIAIWLMGVATATFGAASYCKNGYGFYFISIIARMMQGFGDGMISVAIPAIIVIEFTDDTEFYIGLCRASLGIGLMLGPVVGVFV
jgi:MFS family permease